MKFLCLCYYDTDAFARMSAEEAAKIEPACKPHDAREGDHRPGPYTDGPRQAGAFLIIEAKVSK